MFGFRKTEIEINEGQKKLNDTFAAEIKGLELQLSKAFAEIAELRAKYESLLDLYTRMKGRQNKIKDPEEDLNTPGTIRTN